MTSLSLRVIGAAGIASGALFLLTDSASAFSFTTTFSGTPPTKDIFLESVQFETGEFFDSFALVSSADIISNGEWTGGNTGGASADKGLEATTGVAVQNPSDADVVTNLGNLNLNNIIDTEDIAEPGTFVIDIGFNSAIDNLLVWERGGNSRLTIQALADDGTLIGSARTVNSAFWDDAGFSIQTTEIPAPQKVTSEGFNVVDFFGTAGPVSKFRLSSESSFNGPDFKVVGTKAAATAVPEPGLILGLGLVGGALFLRRYRQA